MQIERKGDGMIHYEVRKSIIEAWERGIGVKELKSVYGYGKTSIYNLITQNKRTGTIEPRLSTRGRKPKISAGDLQRIDAIIKERPDITLNEMIEKLDLPLSESRMSRIVREKLGYTYKKRWCMLPKENGRT
jgi:transposase